MKAHDAVACLIILSGICIGRTAAAELLTTGQGPNQSLTADQFPPGRREQYALFEARCTHCHPMTRPITALKTGIAPISGYPFTADFIKKYVVRMMRKPNSGLSHEDAKQVIDFLDYALGLAQNGHGDAKVSDKP